MQMIKNNYAVYFLLLIYFVNVYQIDASLDFHKKILLVHTCATLTKILVLAMLCANHV